jgi:hypothetical protein
MKSLKNVYDVGSAPGSLNPEHQAIPTVILRKSRRRVFDETARESLGLEVVDRVIMPVTLE